MVQTRQQISELINSNRHRLPNYERLINNGVNDVSFRLSNIIDHLNRFRVNDILTEIEKYNNYHVNKVPSDIILVLRDFDAEVLNLIEYIRNINRYNIRETVTTVRSSADILLAEISNIYEKIKNDYDLSSVSLESELGVEGAELFRESLSNTGSDHYKLYTNLKIFILMIILRNLADKELDFISDGVGTIIVQRTTDRDEINDSIIFDSMRAENIVIDI